MLYTIERCWTSDQVSFYCDWISKSLYRIRLALALSPHLQLHWVCQIKFLFKNRWCTISFKKKTSVYGCINSQILNFIKSQTTMDCAMIVTRVKSKHQFTVALTLKFSILSNHKLQWIVRWSLHASSLNISLRLH